MVRGIAYGKIFGGYKDREEFLDCLAELSHTMQLIEFSSK
jgi:hypothetical protein